jgi:ubiquinone/menaquinone biosynthesis C-methylase UbiE
MTNSISFDRAAGFYDQTRLLHEPIAQHGIQAILDLTGPRARVLDVGTGTGRISIPLLERGLDLIGCDLSAKMLLRLQEKLPAAPVAQADASLLPFPASHFDAVLTVHVMHLIHPWREALSEFRRVLVSGGLYLNVKTWEAVGNSIRGRMRDFWRSWLEAQDIYQRLPGVQEKEEFFSELRSLGAHFTEMEVIRYPLTFTLNEELERFASRVSSHTWDIPDTVFNASIEALRTWVNQEYRDLDQPRADEVQFLIDVARCEG